MVVIWRYFKIVVPKSVFVSLRPSQDLPDSLRELHLDHNQIHTIGQEDLTHYGELYR
jgi:Leucine-rich repeat (LRR) protein